MSSLRTSTEELTLQQEIEGRQDEVLAQLDDLERQIATLMAEFTERLQGASPMENVADDASESDSTQQDQAA